MSLYNLVFSDRRSIRLRRHLLFWMVWCIYWLTTYLIPTMWVPAWNLRGPLRKSKNMVLSFHFLGY